MILSLYFFTSTPRTRTTDVNILENETTMPSAQKRAAFQLSRCHAEILRLRHHVKSQADIDTLTLIASAVERIMPLAEAISRAGGKQAEIVGKPQPHLRTIDPAADN